MTDRELLEAAAKAAGIKARWYICRMVHLDEDGLDAGAWLPLEDDGDALRLAVALRIEIRKYGTVWEVVRYGISSAHRVLDVKPPTEDSADAACSAHRRAIVLAAAALAASEHEVRADVN